MRIAQVAPLTEAVPPKLYGGTERVVHWLTEECKIAIRIQAKRKEVGRKAMVDGAKPVRITQVSSLIIRDRGKWKISKRRVERAEVRQVQTAVQSRQRPIRDVTHQRCVKHVDMEVQNIKFIDPAANFVEHDHMVGQRIPHRRIES